MVPFISILLAVAVVGGPNGPTAAANPISATKQNADLVSVLVQALTDGDPEIQDNVNAAIRSMGRDAVPGLEDALRHKDAKIRTSAAWLLGQIGTREALPALTKAMAESGQDKELRRATLWAIGQILEASPEKEIKKLQGVWQGTSLDFNGDEYGEKEASGFRFVVRGDKATLFGPQGEKRLEATMAVDFSKQHPEMALTTDNGSVFAAIYSQHGHWLIVNFIDAPERGVLRIVFKANSD